MTHSLSASTQLSPSPSAQIEFLQMEETFHLYPYTYVCPQEGYETDPKDANGKIIHSDVPITETWKSMEKLVDKGWAKSIGVSNFNSEQITEILNMARIKPVVNQVVHVIMTRTVLSVMSSARTLLGAGRMSPVVESE